MYLRIPLGCLVQYDKTVLQTHFGASSPLINLCQESKDLYWLTVCRITMMILKMMKMEMMKRQALMFRYVKKKNLCIDCIIYLPSVDSLK